MKLDKFSQYDMVGQAKALPIILDLFKNFKIEYTQHYRDKGRTDIRLTAHTQTDIVTYVIECKDRTYTNEWLLKNGAMLEINKYNSMKSMLTDYDRCIYFNTTANGYIVFDLTNQTPEDFGEENRERGKTTVINTGKTNKPYYTLFKNNAVKIGSYNDR